ncbi:senecionine N-oxygenase-like isoform X2 [Achroia grisella]|uniref:senecionine N-oxygenase-like isoform X2 n=1 Tax=Achroia grisella TaxID=688607 RepID=UPI0027D3048C|nr:senecionine N-oxygenase-like isoform X2 [Achroia grisella]
MQMSRSIFLICAFCLFGVIAAINNSSQRVCIIGAGIAGLSTARYLMEEGIQFTVLEATKYVGGTWRYDSRIGTDENGLPLHTSMYKYLRTNLPKPAMELRGFPLPQNIQSFPSGQVYYDYIQSYAEHFNLIDDIKFLHNVISVKRIDNTWKVKHKHVISGKEFEEDYDFVIIGTGHHSKPNMPNIPGENLFKGSIIHSHDYRVPDPYKQRRVLVIGAGPSGMDIGLEVCNVSRRLIHSHHSNINYRTPFPSHYIKKPDVKEFDETGVYFVDGTFEELDDVIYCTDESCGLDIAKHSVVPLYNYVVNIKQPTMMFLGLVVRACLPPALDAQARYTVALIKGNFTLPSKENMMLDWQHRWNVLRSLGKPLSHIHFLGEKEDEYYAGLTKESGIDRVPPVIYKIRACDTEAKLENLYTYRSYTYTVLNNESFHRTVEKKLDQ